jgi:SAM-dependent methyltransferase
MEFQLGGAAEPREMAAYLKWRDKYAADEERCRRYEPNRRRELLRRFSAWLDARMVLGALSDLPPGASVLDLPCGGGRISRALEAAGLRSVAADYSRFMLRESEGAARSRIRADALRLPFRPDAFEAVVCFRFMQAVPRALRIEALSELGRVARRVVVSYPSVYSLRSLRRFVRGREVPRNRLSEEQVASEVVAAGLEPLAFRYKVRLLYEDFVVVARRREAGGASS